jgi:hypothetical protein
MGAAEQSPFTPPPNHNRNYWRSHVVHEAARAFGYLLAVFEVVLIQHRTTLGPVLVDLVDELEQQSNRDGRTAGQHRYARRRCEELARAREDRRSRMAMRLPPPTPSEAEPRLAGF